MRRIAMICLLLVGSLTVAQAQKAYTQEGFASYYADKFHGRTTASGERYDKTKHTAAHMSLPFGTVVRVTNEDNGKTTVVRINDRGPFVPNRIIDLSRAAAESIDLIQKGKAKVKIEIVDKAELNKPIPATNTPQPAPTPSIALPPQKTPSTTPQAKPTSSNPGAENTHSEFYSLRVQNVSMSGYGVQIASYHDLSNLLKQASQVDASLLAKLKVQVTEISGQKGFKLIIGTFAAKSEAETYKARLQSSYPGCFVVSF